MELLLAGIAIIAATAWVVSYRRSSEPRRAPSFFLAVASLDDEERQESRAAVIDEKHRLEARASRPAIGAGVLAALAALFLVLGNLYSTPNMELRWCAIELAVIAIASAGVAAWCVARTGHFAVVQSQLYRRVR